MEGYLEVNKRLNLVLFSQIYWYTERIQNPSNSLTILNLGFYILLGASNVPLMYMGLTIFFYIVVISLICTIYITAHSLKAKRK